MELRFTKVNDLCQKKPAVTKNVTAGFTFERAELIFSVTLYLVRYRF
jgi:hypothetical protein